MDKDLQEVSYHGCPGKVYIRKPKPPQVCSHCGMSTKDDIEHWSDYPPGVGGMFDPQDGQHYHRCEDGQYGWNQDKP